jgi:hypothetical protein
MFGLLSWYFAAFFIFSFVLFFFMTGTETTIDEILLLSMKFAAGLTVVMGLCINWKDYKG